MSPTDYERTEQGDDPSGPSIEPTYEQLRARVAKLEDALHILRDRIWPEDEESFRVIDAALKDAPQ